MPRPKNKDTIQYKNWIATKRFEGVYYARNTQATSSTSVSLSTKSQEVATRELIRLAEASVDLNYDSPTACCGELLNDWYAWMVNRGGDTRNYKSALKVLKPFFNRIHALDFTVETGYRHLNNYKELRLRDGVTLQTITKEIRYLSASLNYAKSGIDPYFKGLQKPIKLNGGIIKFFAFANDNKRNFVLEPDQAEEFLSECLKLTVKNGVSRFRGTEEEIRRAIHLATLLGLLMSARLGSILDLKWDRVYDNSIDFHNPELEGRRKRRPHNAIPSELRPYLEEARSVAKTEYVIEIGGKKVTTGKFSSWFRKAREASGLYDRNRPEHERFTFHSLRHTSATYLRRGGLSIERVADWLGHSDSKITAEIYSHASPEHQKEESEIAGNILRNRPLKVFSRESKIANTPVQKSPQKFSKVQKLQKPLEQNFLKNTLKSIT